jgi:hypothetical protein
VFAVEQRDALRERALRLAEADDRVVAGAAVGSLAIDDGDRFSVWTSLSRSPTTSRSISTRTPGAQRSACLSPTRCSASRFATDGVGGADPDGQGLVGLGDRATALGGRLTIESPADGGTLVAAAIPLPGEARPFEPGTAHQPR